ncbi:MAG: hypothetical protein ACRC4N_07120, partial [Gammaproteobacteria bacterium]
WFGVFGKGAAAILEVLLIGSRRPRSDVPAAEVETTREGLAEIKEIETEFEFEFCLNESGEDRASRSDHPRTKSGPVAILSDGAS